MASPAERRLSAISSHIGMNSSFAVSPLAARETAYSKKPISVCVTGACGNIAYSILFMIASGEMLGADQPVELRLLDIPQMANNLQGVVMEIADCSYPLVSKIVATTDYKTAFENVDVALLIGARPRGPGMDRADLLKANAAIFSGQGKALNDYASRSVKVLVVGNPANTNACIAMNNAPKLSPGCFHAMTRLDQNRALGQLGDKLNVGIDRIKNVTIWGNHSNQMYADVNNGVVVDFPTKGLVTPIKAALNDDAWLAKTFVDTVALRGGAIIKARGKSSAASAAKAAVDHVREWCLGTPKGEWSAFSVPSDGSYGVPKGLIFSFPVTCAGDGSYKIVQGLSLDAHGKKRLQDNIKELEEEKAMAFK